MKRGRANNICSGFWHMWRKFCLYGMNTNGNSHWRQTASYKCYGAERAHMRVCVEEEKVMIQHQPPVTSCTQPICSTLPRRPLPNTGKHTAFLQADPPATWHKGSQGDEQNNWRRRRRKQNKKVTDLYFQSRRHGVSLEKWRRCFVLCRTGGRVEKRCATVVGFGV